MDSATAAKIARYSDIPGWFNWLDRNLFDTVLSTTDGAPGVLVELGAYLGRSAVIIGNHLGEGDRFVVVDLFGSDEALGDTAADDANRRENTRSYSTLTRQRFEANYLSLHDTLPEIVQGLSSDVVNHVEPGTARFVHVDASHLYDQVAADAQNAKLLLRPDGVVVFDDYRSEHTPGVAAAVWEAVANHGLVPFALTRRKLYGTFGPADAYLAAVRRMVEGKDQYVVGEQQLRGHPSLRIKPREPAKVEAPPAPRPQPPAAKKPPRAEPPEVLTRGRRIQRRIARDYLPPVLTRALLARRRR